MSDVTPVEAAAITKASKAKAAKRTTRKAKVTTPAKARKATSKKPVPKTPAKGKAKAAAAPKKSKGKVKAAPKASANSKRKSCGLPIAEKRERFLKTLKKLQATSAIAAVTGVKISETDGTLTAFDCACLGWYKGPLVTDGLVKIAKLEDVRALSYYLTAKGKKQ